MKKSKGSIEARLIRSAEQALAIAKGKGKPARTYSMPMTAREITATPAPKFVAADVARIRAGLNASQKVFADALNVSLNTVRSWEQGTRPPSGPSLRLLEVAEQHPDVIVQTALRTSVASSSPVKPVRERRGGKDRRGATVARVRGTSRAVAHR